MKKKLDRPSIASLKQFRKSFLNVQALLQQAFARASDIEKKAKIARALRDVQARLNRLESSVDRVKKLQLQLKTHDARIITLKGKLKATLARQYRGNSRWLRRWERL